MGYYRQEWNKLTLLFHFARNVKRHISTGATQSLYYSHIGPEDSSRGGTAHAAGWSRAVARVLLLWAPRSGAGRWRDAAARTTASLSRYFGHEIFSQLSTGGGTQVRVTYLKAYFSLAFSNHSQLSKSHYHYNLHFAESPGLLLFIAIVLRYTYKILLYKYFLFKSYFYTQLKLQQYLLLLLHYDIYIYIATSATTPYLNI